MIPEAESAALRTELAGWERRASSALARAEVVRACARVDAAAREVAARVVAALDLIAVDAETLDEAARLDPFSLHTIDAIHVATALQLGDALGTLITYDERLLAAAHDAGLPATAPA